MSTARKYDDVELPEGWRTVRLDAIADVIGGSTPSRDRDEFWGGSIPWVVPSEITSLSGRCLTYTNECITEAGLQAAGLKILPAGSVLLTSRATIGAAAINTRPVATNQGFQNLVAKDGTNSVWLYYCISSMRRELDRRAAGSTFAEISRDNVRSLPILYPPLPEQRAIADVLDSIDVAIERTEAVIAATETLRDSLLHELLTRGVPGWHTEWKDVPGIGTIPANWEVGRLGEVIMDGPTNGIYKPELDYGDGSPIIRIGDFISGELVNHDRLRRVRVEPQELQRYAVGEGEILINRVNSLSHIGKTVLVPAVDEATLFESNMMKLKLNDRVHPKFGEIVLLSSFARRHFVARAKKAVQQASINQQDVAALPFPLPSMPEQQTIVDFVQSVDRRIDASRIINVSLVQAKSTVADALLTGRIRLEVD